MVKDQVFAFRTKQNADKCYVPRKFNVVSKARQNVAESQGVKSDFIENDKCHVINNNDIDKWVSLDTNQCVNNQSSTLHVNTNVECANRFAILAETEEVDESLQGNTNFFSATDASQGETRVKNTPVVTQIPK